MAGDCPQLHLRHHRRSEGRGLSPPRRLSERPGQHPGLGDGAAPGLSVDPAHVSLQRLVLSLDHHRPGRNPRVPAPGRGGSHLPGVRRTWCDPPLRRAHRHADHPRRRCRRTPRLSTEGTHDDRRRATAGQRPGGDGADGYRRDPRLWPDRGLWPGGGLRLAWGMEHPAAAGTGRAEGAPGGEISGAGRFDGRRCKNPGACAQGRRHHRRGLHARQHRHEGLSEELEGHPRGVCRRLVPYRRSGGLARGRLHRTEGPRQGHHHLRRREHLLHRG